MQQLPSEMTINYIICYDNATGSMMLEMMISYRLSYDETLLRPPYILHGDKLFSNYTLSPNWR